MPSADESSRSVIASSSNATPERSLNRQVVLEEDEYTEALSKIIARDFFPSLAHLEATNTFLTSLDSQDPHQIQESVRRLADLRATPQTARRSAWTEATPYDRTPYDTPLRTPRESVAGSSRQPERPRIDTSLSLDAFQAKYTSEDNSSFTQILDDENQQRRQRYGWAWQAETRARAIKDKEVQGRERLLLTAGGGGQNQKLITGSSAPLALTESGEPTAAGSSDELAVAVVGDDTAAEKDGTAPEVDVMARRKDTRSAIVPAWNFKTRNALMFPPDANTSPYHPPPLAVQADGTPLPGPDRGIITHSSTRLPSSSSSDPSASVPPSPTRSRIGAAISGTPYVPRNVEDTPKVGGYGFVDALPTPVPDELGQDVLRGLMTMGTLLATPRVIRGDGDEDEEMENGGESSSRSRMDSENPFTIHNPTSRDALGRKLGVQASRSLREKAALLSSSTPRSLSGGGIRKRKSSSSTASEMLPPATPRGRNADLLSPAARTLLGRTRTGNALGLTPRSTSASGAGSGTPKGLGGKTGMGRGADLRNIGWSPASTPRSVSNSRSGGGSGRR